MVQVTKEVKRIFPQMSIHPVAESEELCKAHNTTYQQLLQGNNNVINNTVIALC